MDKRAFDSRKNTAAALYFIGENVLDFGESPPGVFMKLRQTLRNDLSKKHTKYHQKWKDLIFKRVTFLNS